MSNAKRGKTLFGVHKKVSNSKWGKNWGRGMGTYSPVPNDAGADECKDTAETFNNIGTSIADI